MGRTHLLSPPRVQRYKDFHELQEYLLSLQINTSLFQMENREASRYAARGVSSSKSEVHKAIAKMDKGLFPTAFCKIVPDFEGEGSPYCLAMHADGAGTKSSLAYAYWRETGDMSVWKGIAQDAIVMNTDDLLCVGITGGMMLSSTIGRNKMRVPGEVIAAVIEGSQIFVEQMRKYGIDITLRRPTSAILCAP